MNAMRLFAIVQILFFALACEWLEPDIDEDDFGPSVSFDCSYSTEAVYAVGSDVSSDFSVSGISATVTVTASTCSGVNAGDSEVTSVDTLERNGNTITLVVDGDIDSASVSGTTVNYSYSGAECISGVYFSPTYDGGSLDTAVNTMTMNFTTKVDYDYCAFSYAERDSNAYYNTYRWKDIFLKGTIDLFDSGLP